MALISQDAARAGEAPESQNEKLSSLGIPENLRPQFRKFGLWDYKQTDASYRDFTKFNYGATGRAAGFDEKQLLAWANASRPTPEDVELITRLDLDAGFTAHRKMLERLRDMAEEDKTLSRIASDYTWLRGGSKWPRPDPGLSDERWKEYRRLFSSSGLQEGILRTAQYPDAIFLIVHARGIVTGGASAGYVYSKLELTPLTKSPREDLNTRARKSVEKGSTVVFRRIDRDWYAFYEVDW